MTYGLIAIVDKSITSGYNDESGAALAGALAHQARQIGAAYYVGGQPVVWYGKNSSLVPAGAWQVVILEDPNQAGILGYHDLDVHGSPYGRVFVKPCREAGVELSTVISHEVCEAVVDPYANLWADANKGATIAFECCDPVENDSYELDGHMVSNFVNRRWFDTHASGGTFDHMGKLTKPFSMTPGGYLITMKEGQIQQVFGSEYPDWRRVLRASAPQPSRTVWREVRLLAEAVEPTE